MTETFSISELSRLCQEETARYVRREPFAECYCLELFRQAIVARDESAWAAIYAQYADFVRRWLGATSEEGDEVVTMTFTRFWHAVDSEKFGRFSSLSGVLQYLKMCAKSVRIDEVRLLRASAGEKPLDDASIEVSREAAVEDTVIAETQREALWRMVQEALPDDAERTIIYLSYVIGLTPREISTRHPHLFPDVTEVYRLKRNALDRLRRQPELQQFL